jgi:hypothetical protein
MTYPGQEPAAPADDRNSIWVQSDLAPDGSTYVTSIHYDADQSRILTPETAYAYVAEVFRAAVMAEHDAAVIRQLRAMNITLKEAAGIVAELREDRPPLDDAATAPLRLVPGCCPSKRPQTSTPPIGDISSGRPASTTTARWPSSTTSPSSSRKGAPDDRQPGPRARHPA